MFKKVHISQITLGRNYSREEVGDIQSLANSIRDHGLLQPLIISEDNVLLAGFRRYAALKHLGFNDLVDVRVSDSPVVNLIENLERQNLTFYQEAVAIRELFSDCTEREVADALGVTRGWSRPRIKVWDLPPDIIEMVKDGRLTPSKVTNLFLAKDKEAAFDRLRGGGSVANPSTKPGKKEIQGAITVCLERNLPDITHALRWVLGDIDEEEFWDNVQKD